MKNIIFDLDLTLVDTSVLESARHERNWNKAYSLIPQTSLYAGMSDVFEIIRKYNINAAIVSTAPRTYVEKLVDYYGIPVKAIVAYHDASPIKPHPAPMLKALDLLGVTASSTISFGDRVIDIQSSKSAGIESVACFWGTKERQELIRSGYSHAIVRPSEILTLIR